MGRKLYKFRSWRLPTKLFSLLASVGIMLGIPLTYQVPKAFATDNCTATVYNTGTAPSLGQDFNDTNPITVGVKFSVARPTTATAISFYRTTANDVGYTVRLFEEDGDLLGSGNIVEGQSTVPTWQTVSLSSPVTLDAGTTYVAAYYSSNGHYFGLNEAYLAEQT